MMELTCAFILISASVVLATPHGYGGYGVKGGASARAESSASAGAFGGVGEIPVPVPLGAGYSGSFSKSSSSNSASSSASSSSSSSSFSYSGSIPGGFGLNGGAPGHGGCSSGRCQTAGGNGIPSPHGSSAYGYNSANAAASAGAGAVSGLGCQGLSCAGDSQKCTSGQCKPKPQTGTTSIDSDSNKCTAGQCGSASENGASPTDYGSNDIRAVTESSESANNAKEKTSLAYNGAGSDCSQGKCGSPGSPSSSSNYYGHNLENSYQGSSVSNKQQASSLDTGITSHYQKPSTHLETPKLDSKCNFGNCNARPAEPGNGISASSYHVPIHGTYEKGEPKPSCDGVKCENQPNRPYSPTDNSVTIKPSSFDYPSSTNCAGSSCFGIPASQVTGGPFLTVKPSNVNFGHSPSHVPNLSVPSCNSPNCSPSPTNPALTAGSNAAPGHIGFGKPSDVNKPSNDKLPPYTGGFGGPAGILNPNEYDVPAPTGNPSLGHASTPQNNKPLGSAPTGCNSPSCSVYPSASGSTGGPVQTGTYSHKPGADTPSEKLPTYTGGFGGPAGTLKPSEFDVHATVTNKPNYGHPGNPSYNTQSPTDNIGTPGCKAGAKCGGYSPTADATSGATAPSGYFGTTKPNTGINSPNDKLPYTGGFGGQGGVLISDKHDIHATGPSSPGHTPSGTYNIPPSSGHPGGCTTPNCYSSLGSTAAANAQAESFGVTKPSSGPHLSSVTLPAYPSGYDRPSGVHRPNEISGPASTPSFIQTQSPSSPGSYISGCKTGNCANYPSSGPTASSNAQPGSFGTTKPSDITPMAPTHPQYTGGFGGPSSTFKPNEYIHVTPIAPSASANVQPGSFGTTKPTDVNPAAPTHPQYTGGFGGPSGTFKPIEHNHDTPIAPLASANAQPGSFGTTKPTDVNPVAPTHPQNTGDFGGPSGTFKPNEHTHVTPIAPSASANAQPGSFGTTKPTDVNQVAPTHPQYTGGFGGPSGTFKPNEHTHVIPSVGSAPANCRTPNCVSSSAASADAISGPNAHPGSYGITKPSGGSNPSDDKPIYSGGFGAASGLLKPNEYTIPAVSPASNIKPTGVPIPAACTSGNCNPHVAPDSAIHSHNGASAGAHATAAAEANAVAYSGGFGGPPGVLTPYDDGKIGALPSYPGQAHGPQTGGAHGSHNANIHSQHDKISEANSGPSAPTGLVGAYGNTGSQAGSIASSVAHAGAAAGASAGAHGYNPYGSQYNHAGNIKSGSSCGGGCGGSGGGTYSGGSGLDISGGHGIPKPGYSVGLSGGGSTSGAAAKSLAGANAFGVGGSYASSSASAHASAGAYTKGGYGKR